MTEQDRSSYTAWIGSGPPFGVLLELMCCEWDETRIVKREEIYPWVNAVGLYWRLTGIAKESL